MTSQDLPGEQTQLETAAPVAGLRAMLAKLAYVARRQWLSLRLRRVVEHKSPAEAEAFFAPLLARMAASGRQISLLTGAVLRGARAAESDRKWLAASRLWTWYARASGDAYKAGRNLIRCARSTTIVRNDAAAVGEALQCWNCLGSIEPNSPEARQGIAWCHSALARHAEQIPDWPAARAHWSAVLERNPDDPGALDGLRRVLDAEATAAPENAARARALHEQLQQVTGPEYGAQCTAAKLLLEAGAPELALEFVEGALARTHGAEALLLLLRCRLARAEYEDAAAAINELAEGGDLSVVPAAELRTLLSNTAQQCLSRSTIVRLAAISRENGLVGGALVPHLIAHNLGDELVAAAEAAAAGDAIWPEVLVLETARELLKAGHGDHALRLMARFSASAKFARAFSKLADAWTPDQLDRVVASSQNATEAAGFAALLAAAEYHAAKRDWPRATGILDRIAAAGAAERAYLHERDRLGALTAQIAVDADPASVKALVRFLTMLLPQNTKAFFTSPKFAELCDDVLADTQFQRAPESSRTGRLREHHFVYHMERRENQPADSFGSDFALCEAVLRYFAAMAQFRPAERIPASADLRARLTRSALRLRGGSADVLMSYAILRDRPDCDLKSETLFTELAGWYVTRFMTDCHVPSCCMSPDTLAALNVVEQDHSVVGVAITRFANFIRGQTPDLTARCHTENPVESLLLCLEILPTLSRHLHYRPFFARMLQTGTRSSLADLCIALLAGRNDLQFSRILNGDAVLDSRRELREPKEGAPQNVLLIGHAGEGTGLSRNLRMLTAGLTGDDIALTTMFYESDPERFGEDLKRWRENCRSEPIVVAAVNAHDIPTLFIRDRHGVLDTCRVAGFFLWETSRAPRVQHLGVALVDEVWAPTRYVAEVYASLAKTFVVGKGLFAPDSAARARPRPPGPLRFLTVFDFHSSIERKNPLASALAFRKAFPGGEDVELIVKASNVNPQHPGNAYGQWERLCAEAAQDSRIRIITERYSEEQMNALIADVGCVVSLHRSEGFGYVLSDAMAVGIPVIATAHSGNLDFCDADTSFLVDCRLVPVSALGAHWESNEAMWAEPDIDSAAAQMRRVCADYPAALSVAAAGQRVILAKYTTTVFAANLRARLAAIRGSGRGVDASSEAVH